MLFLLDIAVGLTVAVFQTTVVPQLPLISNCYDLMLPYIIYQAVFRPARESVVLVIGAGGVMGHLSGAPAGLFIMVYLWVMMGVWWGVRFFHMGNYLLVPFVVAVAVLVENAFFALYVMIRITGMVVPITTGGIIFGQVGWALISAPLFMMLLNAAHHGWRAWFGSFNADNGN
ncbi:MAG: hypothetical protein V2B19_04620 [Pseudomonadota bacterium]